MAKRIGTLVIILLIVLFAWKGYDYLHYRSVNAVSDAAFIKSDRLATLSFKVGGKVVEMSKEENAPVKRGELLARIDPKDFELARAKAQKGIAAADNAIAALRLKRDRLEKTLRLREKISGIDIEAVTQRVESLSFRIDATKRRLEKLNKDTERYRRMLEQKLIASTDYETLAMQRDALADEVAAMQKERDALLKQKKKALESYEISRVSLRQIKELDKTIEAKMQERDAMLKSLKELKNKISYTRLFAPFDGVIAKRFVVAPHVVSKGSPIYALVDPTKLYCEVLLSEKKMHGVQPGNKATVEVEALDGKRFEGIVESIAPTSASTFSLVPRDIASGEFTKLDQRFVVRIRLKSIEGLRAGMG
ncbi:HlyD family secretion protein, partial [Nitratifractor sp.]